jgi:hypothetical protein
MAKLVLLRGARQGSLGLQVTAARFSILPLAIILLGCSCLGIHQPTAGARDLALGARCEEDAQCRSSFCDLGRCVMPEGVYGRPCVPAPRTSDGLRDGKLHVCGAYLCLEGRCRSCTSDDQCRSELGSPRCYRSDTHPGARCGDPPRGSLQQSSVVEGPPRPPAS